MTCATWGPDGTVYETNIETMQLQKMDHGPFFVI